jgi:hypothetical protein
MMKRNPTESSESLRERVLALAWSLWAEMGVPGWARRHQDWAIDPEPLILFTALLGESDPRLRDECIRWCARNSRYISIARLRNLLKAASPALRERWGPFAATVNAFGGPGWLGATEPLAVRPSTKDGLDDFRRPAVISLRLRTTFGVGARSEILLYFIAHPDARATAADLSEVVRYSKRNVEKELEALRKAGMLGVERRRNRLEHYVVQPQSLLLFAAPRPDVFPRWDAIFAVLGALLDYEERVDAMDAAVAAIEARRLLREQAAQIQGGNLPPPDETTGRAVSMALLRWGGRIMEALERGDATSLGWAVVEPVDARGWHTTPVEGVRSVVSPLLATATDLTVWADTRAAQERISEVLRKLVLATTNGLRRIDMAAGEGVQHGGYDGIVVNAVPAPYVPEGQSVWEIGVSGDIKRKADADYEKRSANPIGADPAETTFVFVTPRRWASKRIWEKERKHGGPWRDVRVIDADDLETWLGLAPAVHAWLSAVLGKSWPSVQDLRSYWSDWRNATQPALSAEIVLAGRETVAEDLRLRIEAASSLLRVQGESADEALACIAATIDGMDQADALLARSLVVNDTAGWDWAVTSTSPLVLIPRFADPDSARAIRHGNRVLIPVGREEGSRDDLVLPRLRRDAVRAALQRIGVAEGDADSLAARGRVSLTSLRRRLSIDKGKPAWAHRVEAPALLPALLAGAWDERKPGDQEVIAGLAERPYQDVERTLVHWAQASDPPVRKVGPMWFLVSKEDAWDQLSTYLTPTDLARFRDALLRALGIADPALDLPPEERWMASIRGREHPLSAHLREGLVDTLAIMGARSGETTFFTGHTGQWHADDITGDLLDHVNAGEDATLWSSLSGMLPLLAEAAPKPFLRVVDVALSRDPSPLVTLFADAGPRASLFVASPHTGLLWALENLGWSPDYMSLVSHHLATLTRLDPGGSLSNRPFESLRSIFLIWNPQTAASLSQRLGALDKLRENMPDIAWRLMLAILPKQHDVSSPSHAPRWRDWKDGRDEHVPFEEYRQAIEAVVARLLDDVGANGQRWSDLMGLLGDLPWDRVVAALENTSPEAFSSEDRMLVWDALRSAISKHRSFADADWALPADVVDRMERVYERLTPRDPARRAAPLFTPTPDLVEGGRTEWADYLRAVQDAQADAIRALRRDGGLAGLRHLAHLAERSDIVGVVIALTATAGAGDEQAKLFDLLDAPDTSDRLLALGYAAKRFDLGGWPWARSVLETAAPGWAREKRAAFLRALPFVSETWDWAERFGEDTEHAYWLVVPPTPLDDPAKIERAARLLIRYERPAHAVDLLGMSLHGTAPQVDPDLTMEALERVFRQDGLRQGGGLVHDIAMLLDYLAATSETIDMSRLAQLEWMFLPLLRGVGRPAGVLGRELAHNPGFFMDILCLVFRAHDEEPREATDEQTARAMLGYQLLDSWRRPPGYRDDGTVDEDALDAWVAAVRTLAVEQGRQEIADQQIGRVLHYVPDDPDGLWPHRAVRRLVERIASSELETGLELGLRNSRGATSRGVSDGGAQERALQVRYLDDAQHLNVEWPRTAAMVRRIAHSYAEEARWQDERVEISEARLR